MPTRMTIVLHYCYAMQLYYLMFCVNITYWSRIILVLTSCIGLRSYLCFNLGCMASTKIIYWANDKSSTFFFGCLKKLIINT
jgi:hypothetical protein